MILAELRKGRTNREIAESVKKNGYELREAELSKFLNSRFNLLTNSEVTEFKDSMFHDVKVLYESIEKTTASLTEKIEQWKREGMDREYLMGVSQLREYHLMAMKRLGEIKDAITKVERQYNQTNIIVAKHQTEYLKELAHEKKITINDQILLDLVKAV